MKHPPESHIIWKTLLDHGVVGEEHVPLASLGVPRYLQIMMGVSAWLAAFCLLGAFAILVGIDYLQSFRLVWPGLILCVAAILLDRAWHNAFVGQFAFAIGIAGQMSVASGLVFSDALALREAAIAIAGLEIGMFFAVGNLSQRVVSVAVASLALVFFFTEFARTAYPLALLLVIFALVWMLEFRLSVSRNLIQPLLHGLLWALCSGLLLDSIRSHDLGSELIVGDPERFAVPLAVVATLVLSLREQALRYHRGAGLTLMLAGLAVSTVSLWAPGVGVTFVVLMMGYAHSSALLMSVGGLALLAYLSHFYYLLDISLLQKSVLLMGSGLALLAVRPMLRMLGRAEPDDLIVDTDA